MTRWVLAVDLGTSFSAGAVASDQGVEVLEVGGERRIPSTVLLHTDGRLLAGTMAQRSVGTMPERVEPNPKTRVGKAPMLLGGQPVTAEQALAALLDLFVGEASRRFDRTLPTCLVLTHPVAWSDNQHEVLRAAARLRLPDVRTLLLAEPVAAAWHHAHDQALAAGDSVAVYDLGGGTFDAAVLLADGDGGFAVAGRPGGDPDIGGEAFDHRVYRHFGDQIAVTAPDWWEHVSVSTEKRWRAAAASLRAEARLAKEALSDYPDTSQYIGDVDRDVTISRADLDELIAADVTRTVQLLDDTIRSAGRPPDSLRGIFLTGGASRTPLVQDVLRAAHGARVRTWQDPKTVVALGAARWGWVRLDEAPRPGTTTNGDGPHPGGRDQPGRAGRAPDAVTAPPPGAPAGRPQELVPVLGDVLQVRVTAHCLYALVRRDGHQELLHLDPRTGRPYWGQPFARVVAWAASDSGLLVAERRGHEPVLHVHALSPGLTLRSTRAIPSPADPFVVVVGDTGWVVTRAPGTRPVDNTMGLPWGETGKMVVDAVALSANVPRRVCAPLHTAAFWYLNEDGAQRRLLDPTTPTSVPPAPLGNGHGIAAVLGRCTKPGILKKGPVAFRQNVVYVDGAARSAELVPQQLPGPVRHVHQYVVTPAYRPASFVAGNLGLEIVAEPRAPRPFPFLGRPPFGAARWVPAGGRMYAVAMQQLLPNRQVSLHALVEGKRVDLGGWPALLGNLASVRSAEAPRIVTAGAQLWMGVADPQGTGSQLVRADGTAARVVAAARGWLEPVGVLAGQAYALHAPDHRPGDAHDGPGLLVRVTG